MLQYFFSTCRSDGKERISFMYPPSLLIFLKMIQKKMSLSQQRKLSYDKLYIIGIITINKKRKT
jgi:hypothetical protein